MAFLEIASRGPSVFIVDDDEAILEYYRKLFSQDEGDLDILNKATSTPKERTDLRLFSDPKALLDAFAREEAAGNPVALCILDSGSGCGDSRSTAKAIKDLDAETRVIICSASQAEDADLLRQQFDSGVLLVRKPFAADEFRLLVHSLLREWDTKRSLRRNEERLTRILEATRVGTWEWDVASGETVFNERWAEMVGYSLAELEPTTIETWNRFVHPDDGRRSEELLLRHFRGELPYYDVECRMRHKDGSWLWVHDRGQVIKRDPDGKPLVMSGTHTDISDRKYAELGREEIAERMETTIDATSDGLWDWDIAKGIVAHNRRWCELLDLGEGYREHPVEVFVGMIHPEDRARVQEAIRFCLDGQGIYSTTYRLQRRDGGIVWVLDRGNVAARGPEGEPLRMVGSLIKIHEEEGGKA